MGRGPLRIETGVREAHIDPGATGGNLPSTGVERAMGQAAASFSAIGDRIGKWADHAAAVEGQQAGKLAGLDPEFRPTRQMTIRGEAFDKAGLQVYETRTRTAMLAEMEAVYDKHGHDPAALNKALAEKRSTWVGGALTEVKADIATSFDGAALGLNRRATRAYLARIAAEQTAAAQEEASDGLKRVHQLAYGGGLDQAATDAIAGQRGVYAKALTRIGADGKPLFSPDQRRKLLDQFDETVTTARVLGAFDRLPNVAAKQKFIDDFEADFAGSRGLAKEYDLGGFQSVSGHLRAGLSRATTEANVAVRAVKEEVKAVTTALEDGGTVPPEQIAAIEGRIVASGSSPELVEAATQARALFNLQGQLRGQPPEVADAVADRIRGEIAKGGATPERQAALQFVEKFAGNARKHLDKDQLGWAERVGAVQVPPLDPADLVSSLKSRVAVAEEVGAKFGRAPVYLKPDEVRTLSLEAAQGGQKMLAVTAAIAQAAGDRAPAIIGQIADNAPTVAAVADHVARAGGLTAAAEDAANGIGLMKTEGYKSLAPSEQKAREAVDRVIGGTETLAQSPGYLQKITRMANAIYEVRAVRAGGNLADFKPEIYDQALREALGETVNQGRKFGGIVDVSVGWSRRNVVLPPSVPQDKAARIFGALTPEDLGGAVRHRNGTVLTRAELRGASYVTLEPGRYLVALGHPTSDDPKWAVDQTGKAFVLDLGVALPALQRRRPDLR